MSRKLRNLIVAASLFAHPLAAATILNETYTASEMFSMAAFPSRTPTLTMGNTRLAFPTGTRDLEVLMVLPLLPAYSLSLLEPALVTLTFQTGPLLRFNKFAVGITDGQGLAAVMRSDQLDTETYFLQGEFSTPTLTSLGFMSSYALGGGSGLITMTFTLDTSTSVTVPIGSVNESRVYEPTLNRENPLSLIIFNTEWDALEEFGVDSATVTVSQIPEPAGLVFLMAGLSTFAFRRRRTMA